MKTTLAFVFATAVALIVSSSPLQAQFRIGTYDSRAVAVAFFNSPAGQKHTQQLMSSPSMEDAKKDEKLMKALQAKGQAHQIHNHLRAFSTASVSDLLSSYKDDLTTIAKNAKVQLIVSKFEPNFLADDVETVDVTDQIVTLFHPSEKGMQFVRGIKDNAPMQMLEVLQIPATE